MAEINPLRRRMIDDMMIRNLSPATQQSSGDKRGAKLSARSVSRRLCW